MVLALSSFGNPLFSSETVSRIFLLTSCREENLSVHSFKGFYLPTEVSLPFIQFDFRAGLFQLSAQKVNLEVSKSPILAILS